MTHKKKRRRATRPRGDTRRRGRCSAHSAHERSTLRAWVTASCSVGGTVWRGVWGLWGGCGWRWGGGKGCGAGVAGRVNVTVAVLGVTEIVGAEMVLQVVKVTVPVPGLNR